MDEPEPLRALSSNNPDDEGRWSFVFVRLIPVLVEVSCCVVRDIVDDGGKDDAWRRTKTSTHDALHRSRDMIHATHDVTKALPTS